MTKLTRIFAAAAVACSLAAIPAQADEFRQMQVPVGFENLNPATPHGAAKLANRIADRVTIACSWSSDFHSLNAIDVCRKSMIANAVSQLDAQGHTLAANDLSIWH